MKVTNGDAIDINRIKSIQDEELASTTEEEANNLYHVGNGGFFSEGTEEGEGAVFVFRVWCPTFEGSSAKHQCFECGGRGHHDRDHEGFSKGETKGSSKGKDKACVGQGAQTWKGGSGEGMKGKGKTIKRNTSRKGFVGRHVQQ